MGKEEEEGKIPPSARFGVNWQLKQAASRGAGRGGRLLYAGHAIGIPDAEFRDEEWGSTDTPKAENSVEKPKFSLGTLLAEVGTSPPRPVSKGRSIRREGRATKVSQGPVSTSCEDEYDPAAPHLALPLHELLRKIRENDKMRAERDGTTAYNHNPYFIDHIFGNAPYTFSLCKQCEPGRKCRLHRHIFEKETSISLCSHIRMNLYWAVNDPNNDKLSWKLQIKEYFGRTIYDGEFLRFEHEQCKVYRPRERVEKLAARMIEDMRHDKERLRGNHRRIAHEIYALLGAWEHAASIKLEKQERARKREEKNRAEQKKAQEKLAATLKAVQEMQEREVQTKRRVSVEEGEIVPTIEEEGISAPSIKMDAETDILVVMAESIMQPTPPNTASSTPTPASTKISTPESTKLVTLESSESSTPAITDIRSLPNEFVTGDYHSPPATPPTTVSSRRESLRSNKRKRSTSSAASIPSPAECLRSSERKRSSASSPPAPPAKKTKKVRWAPEIEAAEYTERPRILSPEYVPEAGGLSPIAGWNARGVEDEVDYDDGELE